MILKAEAFIDAFDLVEFVNKRHIRREDIVAIVYKNPNDFCRLYLFYWAN